MNPIAYVVLTLGVAVFILLLACIAANRPTERDARAAIARLLAEREERSRA